MIQKDTKEPPSTKAFTVAELSWFSRNAYNTGLENLNKWDLPYLIRIFRTCNSVIGCFPQDMSAQDLSDLALRQMFCNFVVTSALVVLARLEDNIEERLQRYLEARQHINSYSEQLEEQTEGLDTLVVEELYQKLGALLPLCESILQKLVFFSFAKST